MLLSVFIGSPGGNDFSFCGEENKSKEVMQF